MDKMNESMYAGGDSIKETKADLARRFDALNLTCNVPKFNSEPEDRRMHQDSNEVFHFPSIKLYFSQGYD